MFRYLNKRLQQAFVLLQNYDPGFLALKRSSKTIIAILIAVAIFYDDPRLAMFSAISAMLISRSQTGFTIRERKFTLLLTGFILSIVSIPVSLIAQSDIFSVIFITVASFLAFFLIGLRMVPDFPTIVILSVIVVEMAFSKTLESGIKFSGIYLLTTALVFVMHFVILPTRPYKRMKIQLQIISQNLEIYYRAIISDGTNLDEGILKVHENDKKFRASMSDFKRLWVLFRVQITSDDSLEASLIKKFTGYEKTFEYATILWQFRARSWNSALYRKIILDEKILTTTFEKLRLFLENENPERYFTDLQHLRTRIKAKADEFLMTTRDGKTVGSSDEIFSILSTFSALETLLNEVGQFSTVADSANQTDFAAISKIRGFFNNLRKLPSKVKFSSPAFRFGLRSAIIIGLTMIFYTFYEPNHGYWLVLFAVLLIRPNLGISIKAGRDRLIGTIAGSLAAFGLVYFFPVGSVIFYFLMFVSTFFMVWFLNLDKFIYMVFSLTFLIVCLFMLIFPAEEGIVFLRIGYTAAIVLLIIFLSFLFWPEKARLKFADAIADGLLLQKAYFEEIMLMISGDLSRNSIPKTKKEIELHIIKTQEFYEGAKNEVWQAKTLNHGFKIKMYIQRLLNTLHAMELAAVNFESKVDFKGFNNEVVTLSVNIYKAFDLLSEAIRHRTLPIGFPELSASFDQLCHDFGKDFIRTDFDNEAFKNIWNHSVFLWNLKPLILELEGIRDEIVLKMNEG